MKRFHPFYVIGTFGIIITSLLHILLALGLSVVSNHSVFFTIYPMFLAFMALGVALTIKQQKETQKEKTRFFS